MTAIAMAGGIEAVVAGRCKDGKVAVSRKHERAVNYTQPRLACDLRLCTSQKCEAVPRRARVKSS